MSGRELTPPEEPLSTLRGAGVAVDVRKVARVAVALLLVGLAVLVTVLFVAGAHRNAQITRLHHDGVPVEIRVSGCLGQISGSGSNAAGYSCRGTFTLGGHRYNEIIPGSVLRPPGTIVRAIAVPGDPQLLETTRALAGEHSSGKVFILPAVLLAVLALALAAVVLRWRRSRVPTST